ncbi:MAG: potassium-transporting ATPase subunit C, partial [Clostridiales bacterium]
MKTLRNIIGIHLSLLIVCCIIYTLVIWGIGQIFPSAANGYPVEKNGKIVGYKNIGQKFTLDKYFWGRPSSVDYNAASSGASNYGPSNPEYLKIVGARIDTFLVHNPGVK